MQMLIYHNGDHL